MDVILDENGKVIQRSRNLRGIRTYVSSHAIKILAIDSIGRGEGKLCIIFDNGANYETNFASFEVLRDFVRNWRNVYGAPLIVNTRDCGQVSFRNLALIETI